MVKQDCADDASERYNKLSRGEQIKAADHPRVRMDKTPGSLAKVKEVLSGDSLVLQSLTGSSERIFALAYVDAPRFSFKKEGDDPYAFQSREFLTANLLGKQVAFKPLYSTPQGREFGIVWTENGRRYPHENVREGWVTVRNNAGGKDGSEEEKVATDLKAFEEMAKRERLGMHSGQDGIIERINIEDPDQFLKEFKGKIIPAHVERIITGDRLIIRLFVSDKKHYEFMALLAGVQAPKTARKAAETGEALPKEPFGDEATAFVERRLLQRRVDFKVVGLSPQNQIIGSVKHPQGDIAIVLTKAGLAAPFDLHSTMVGAPYMAQIRKAQAEAKEQKRGIYHNYVAPKHNDAAAIPVTVVRVLSADTVFVRNNNGAEKRISLSSIRAPRKNESSEAIFQDAAKEFVRQKLIGKHVRMIIDGLKPANGEYEAKEVATLILNDTNINLLVVSEGFASVIRHRQDDNDRAPNYDELLAAQDVAKAQKKGMWSGKAPSVTSYVDASETPQKAKMNLGGLQRHKRLPAIVDYVKSGSRFTILCPSEGVKLNFVLGGIKTPRSARNASEQGEPYGEEAQEFARKYLNQRDVEINVHTTDKAGASFIGEIFVNRVSFAKLLVEEGLATVHEYSAQQSGNAGELLPAQERAKNAHKNLWKDWDPSQDVEAEAAQGNWANGSKEAAAPQEVKKDLRVVTVTHVDADGRLKIQITGSGTASLSTLTAQFRTFNLCGANNFGLPGDPKNGDFVSAKFSGDGEWYRGRIRANDRANKEADVQFIDYGNKEKIPWSKLRPLAPQFSVQKLKAQAEDAVLSCIQLPAAEEYRRETIEEIEAYTVGPKRLANFDATDRDGTHHITLYETDEADNIRMDDTTNVQLVGVGLAMLKRKLAPWEASHEELVRELREAEEFAKEKKKGMWEYGDITED